MYMVSEESKPQWEDMEVTEATRHMQEVSWAHRYGSKSRHQGAIASRCMGNIQGPEPRGGSAGTGLHPDSNYGLGGRAAMSRAAGTQALPAVYEELEPADRAVKSPSALTKQLGVWLTTGTDYLSTYEKYSSVTAVSYKGLLCSSALWKMVKVVGIT
ncbi:hypothetical protein HPB50_014195 [Hyalomma asiaticum]|uniref:Uncharacterized protein n=1 Tax=Hyalomma asiaticum TaxID=266040 RepID=A0ACB7RT40_HYAAI|nr:hypothetical protein HPB50_014195 [Hyalomma asiaticum]